jgi:hypothetical protein
VEEITGCTFVAIGASHIHRPATGTRDLRSQLSVVSLQGEYMHRTNNSGIPDDVVMIDLDTMRIVATKSGKLILAAKGGQGAHYTFQPGRRTGILDVHLTEPLTAEPHRTLFAIKEEDLTDLLERLAPTWEQRLLDLLPRIIQRTRLGWLRHRGIFIYPWISSGGGVSEFGKRTGKCWTLDMTRVAQLYSRPLDRPEVLDAPDGPFLLHQSRAAADGLYGVLFKETDETGRALFFALQSRKLLRELRLIWDLLEPEFRTRCVSSDALREAIESLPRGARAGS